jgi:shikimate dehydrogenase
MTDKYAVIGNPIGHSKSPFIHGRFASQTGQDLVYTAIEGPPDRFEEAVRSFIAGGGRGMNVTAPFKLQAYAMADEATARARLAGAVNTLKFDAGRIVADNTDGAGLTNDIQCNLGVPLAGKQVLVLGAGGAVRGAILPFLAQQPADLVLANRDVEKARAIAAEVAAHGRVTVGSYADLAQRSFDVVVNATSASLRAELLAVPVTVFGPGCLAYELCYAKGLTPFLRLAKDAGAAQLADGVGMLVEQAAEAFEWWRGIRPQTRALITQLTVPLV